MTTRQSQLISPIENYASCHSDLPVLCAAYRNGGEHHKFEPGSRA